MEREVRMGHIFPCRLNGNKSHLLYSKTILGGIYVVIANIAVYSFCFLYKILHSSVIYPE